jgi:hypothetical protein
MSTTSILDVQDLTLGPLSAEQRTEIMSYATQLSADARKVFRRLLILGQEHGLSSDSIARAAAQARAHFES